MADRRKNRKWGKKNGKIRMMEIMENKQHHSGKCGKSMKGKTL